MNSLAADARRRLRVRLEATTELVTSCWSWTALVAQPTTKREYGSTTMAR